MKESYVSYEIARKLKECGFDWECDHYYPTNEGYWKGVLGGGKYDTHNHNTKQYCASAPTITMAQKWLREVKGIDVLVFNCACGYGWEISKADPQSRGTTIALFDDNGEDEASGMWLTYEKALSAGINRALQFIKNGE